MLLVNFLAIMTQSTQLSRRKVKTLSAISARKILNAHMMAASVLILKIAAKAFAVLIAQESVPTIQAKQLAFA